MRLKVSLCVLSTVNLLRRNGRATGVEFLPNARFRPNEEQTIRTARARKLVIVSSGTLGSPVILERSGIGERNRLQALGIDVVVDVPAVGENFQGMLAFGGIMACPCSHTYADHNVIFAPYLADDEAETLDGIVRNDEEDIESAPMLQPHMH